MFQRLGTIVSRFWPLVLLFWVVLAALIWSRAPAWESVAKQGEFDFLPAESASLQGEALSRSAFPKDLRRSSVVIVARRTVGLQPEDKAFVEEELRPRLEQLFAKFVEAELGEDPKALFACFRGEEEQDDDDLDSPRAETPVRTWADDEIGPLLDSEDGKASLVMVELSTEFLDQRNEALIGDIESLIGSNGSIYQERRDGNAVVPPGLSLIISGSATVGRDMLVAQRESSEATELWTAILVIFLLVIIYRSPILALIPLLTVGLSSFISLKALSILSEHGIVNVFEGLQVYVKVLTYGAGVDYCLFLIARYREELDVDGRTLEDGISVSLDRVGATLTASAGTVMCGIGMLVFARFGKFQQAGVGITFSLAVVLIASLTFTPALLRLFGRVAFWPHIATERAATGAGWLSPTSLLSRLSEADLFREFWHRVGVGIRKRPVTIWAVSLACMLPFAIIGAMFYGYLSYGLLSELPADRPSVRGANAVQSHFPAGMGGEATLLLLNEEMDFIESSGLVQDISDLLIDRQEQLHIADVRSAALPLGKNIDLPGARNRAADLYYVSRSDEFDRQVARMDVVFKNDPFSRHSIQQLEILERAVHASILGQVLGVRFDSNDGRRVDAVINVFTEGILFSGDVITKINGHAVNGQFDIPAALLDTEDGEEFELQVIRGAGATRENVELDPPLDDWKTVLQNTRVFVVGPTASIRDLKRVTDSDQLRVDVLVLTGVYLILVILLRKPAICLYLIVSVFFSYFVTMGVTFVVFWCLDPSGFSGLDWKVPMFLFTILIAVGEDYNIFLMTRVEEEQEKHGLTDGVTVALNKTGSIISSCGFIMAGTFSSLLAGSLVGMNQLGFALAFGVLLDTFVIRPILVPAWLIMLYEGRLGTLGKFLGAPRSADAEVADEPAST